MQQTLNTKLCCHLFYILLIKAAIAVATNKQKKKHIIKNTSLSLSHSLSLLHFKELFVQNKTECFNYLLCLIEMNN